MLYQLSYLSGSLHNKENRSTVNGSGEAMHCDSANLGYGLRRVGVCAIFPVAVVVQCVFAAPLLAGVTPESPEVQKLVNAGLAFLEQPTDEQNANKLGGKCLMALAFLKAGKPDHPLVAHAVEACDLQMHDQTVR